MSLPSALPACGGKLELSASNVASVEGPLPPELGEVELRGSVLSVTVNLLVSNPTPASRMTAAIWATLTTQLLDQLQQLGSGEQLHCGGAVQFSPCTEA